MIFAFATTTVLTISPCPFQQRLQFQLLPHRTQAVQEPLNTITKERESNEADKIFYILPMQNVQCSS